MKQNKSWCPMPWVSLNVRNTGDFRVCCHANISQSKGMLRSGEGEAYNASDARLDEVRNSGTLKELRSAMLKGERHEICSRCNFEDDAGMKSRRFYEGEFWAGTFGLEQAQRATGPDGSIEPGSLPLGFFDLRFGNQCNLKCRMCGPTDSSRWYQEYFSSYGDSFQEGDGLVTLEASGTESVKVKGKNPYSWHESPGFWSEIERNLSGVRKIYTVGGEPLLIERHFDLLERLVRSGRSKETIIEYNSNITLIPDRALRLWNKFKEVRIGASIDGVGRINEYIRHPSKWSQIEKNLDVLDTADAPIRVWIASTVQAYNIYYLPEFLQWKIGKNFRRVNTGEKSPFLTLHPLHNPKYFNIQVLPPEVKQMVEAKFQDFLGGWFSRYLRDSGMPEEKKASQRQKMQELLQSYVNLMNARDLSEQLPIFMYMTEKMDRYRKEDFGAVMPEIAGPVKKFLQSGASGNARTGLPPL